MLVVMPMLMQEEQKTKKMTMQKPKRSAQP